MLVQQRADEVCLDDHNLPQDESTSNTTRSARRREFMLTMDPHGIGALLLYSTGMGFEVDSESSKKGVSQEVLDSIDRIPKKLIKPDMFCAICQVVYIEDKYSLVLSLRCAHHFCIDCISTWLKENDTCPLCRQSVVKPRSPRPEVRPNEIEEDYDMMYS